MADGLWTATVKPTQEKGRGWGTYTLNRKGGGFAPSLLEMNSVRLLKEAGPLPAPGAASYLA